MENKILMLDNIILNADPKDKWEAIRMCGQILVDNGYVTPEYIDSMIDREKSMSVYLGNSVAIPHGLVISKDMILESGISVLQVPKGIAFGDEKAYIFIGIAGKNDEHIEILEKIANVCIDKANVDKMKDAACKEDILNILTGK